MPCIVNRRDPHSGSEVHLREAKAAHVSPRPASEPSRAFRLADMCRTRSPIAKPCAGQVLRERRAGGAQAAATALHWYVKFEGDAKKAPDSGPFPCRREASMLEFCLPAREEALAGKRSAAARVAVVSARVKGLQLRIEGLASGLEN